MANAESILDQAFDLISGRGGFESISFTIPTGFSNVLNFAAPSFTDTYGVVPMQAEGMEVTDLEVSLNLAGEPVKPDYAGLTETIAIPNLTVPVPPTFLTAQGLPNAPDTDLDSRPTEDIAFPPITDVGDAGLAAVDIPSIEYGTRLPLDDITVTAFVPETLAPFTAELPDYIMPEGLVLGDPDRLVYEQDRVLLAAMAAALQTGNVPLSTEQQVLFLAQTEDLVRLQERELDKVRTATAARGFFLPTGAAHASMLLVVEKTLREKEKANMAVRDEMQQRGVAALTAAAQGGLQLEAKHIELHLAYIEHLMQIRRYNVKLAAGLLNTAIDLFNAKVQAIKINLAAYKEYIAAVKAQNTAPGILARVKSAFVDTIEADVAMYTAQVGTYGKAAEADALRYQSQINAVEEWLLQSKTVVENLKRLGYGIEKYKEELQRYQEEVEFDILRAQANRVEFSNWAKGQSLNATQQRVRAAYLGTLAQRATTYGQMSSQATQTISQATQAYARYAQANRGYLAAFTEKLAAVNKIESARDSSLYTLSAYASAKTKADGSYSSTMNHINLLDKENDARREILLAQDKAFDENIRAGQLAAQADAAAGMAQAAYGVFGANMNISGITEISDRYSFGSYTNYADSAMRAYNYNKSLSV